MPTLATLGPLAHSAFPPTRPPVRPVRYDNVVLEASLRRTAKIVKSTFIRRKCNNNNKNNNNVFY